MLAKQLFYLAGLIVIACGMTAFRQNHTQTIHYAFLYKNLFLALIPLGASLPLSLIKEQSPWHFWVWPLLLFWLLFFPNAPYMISDLRHIYLPSPMPRWYDPLMLAYAALSGLYSGFLSLFLVEEYLNKLWPKWQVNLCVFMIWLLTGLGIYLGRIPRWNSWDIINRPGAIFQDILHLITHPVQNIEALALISLYSALLILNYGFWKSLFPKGKHVQEPPNNIL